MAEDFVGVSGSLNESFVGASNDKLFVAGDERVRTELIGKYLPVLKAAFNVNSVRVVGGARNGLDAY